MSWIKMLFREKDQVFVRCNDSGKPIESGGRVEIRYQKEGRTYRASPRNVAHLEPKGDVSTEDSPSVEAGFDPDKATIAEEAFAYTDGACSGNPGPAGIGVVLRIGNDRQEISEYLGVATNNIAELTAILRAAEKLAKAPPPVVIYSDSSYAIGVLTKGWKAKANQDLVARTRRALSVLSQVELRKVAGHAGVVENERADALAVEAVRGRHR